MIRSRLFGAGGTFATVLFGNSLALAADYYFDSVTGDDAKDGSTEATAKKTLKLPSGTGNTVHLKRGSSWTQSLSLNNVTLTTYGCGPRPAINGSVTVNGSTVEGLKTLPTSSNGMNVQSNSTVRDCDIDGTKCTASVVGMGINGENNKIIGNYVHDFSYSASGSTMNNSGGAEGIMVMASNNEVAFNRVVNCQSVNTTLGGFEGGCFEVVNNKGGGKAVSNVSFHHNYCEKSVGLWEGCSGNFSATGGDVLTNHAIIENVTVSYNISVDAMWLFLLQPVNTDFKNVVFANNSIIHTPQSAVYWDSGGGHFSMALAVDSDTSTGSTIKADNQYYKQGSGFQPGSISVKNNLFIDNISSSRQMMFMTNMTDHSNNLFVPANASVAFAMGSTPAMTLNSTEKKVDLAALALTADYRLTASSAAAVDQAVAIDMTTSAGSAGSALNAAVFQTTFNQDVDAHDVPCGAAPDIGASEYCATNSTVAAPWPSTDDGCGSGGATGVGGGPSGGAKASSTGNEKPTPAGGAMGNTSANIDAPNLAAGGSAVTSIDDTNVTPGNGGSSGADTAGNGTLASTAATAHNDVGQEDSACSCHVAGVHSRNKAGAILLAGLTWLFVSRRRKQTRHI